MNDITLNIALKSPCYQLRIYDTTIMENFNEFNEGIYMKQGDVLVVMIEDGVIKEAKLFHDVKLAEKCFTLNAIKLGAPREDIESHLDDGYYSKHNLSVCIVHPEVFQ